MRSAKREMHVLEIRRNGEVWQRASAGMYRYAIERCELGNIHESLMSAEEAHVENYGSMGVVEFRVVSKSVTVYRTGSFRDVIDDFPEL